MFKFNFVDEVEDTAVEAAVSTPAALTEGISQLSVETAEEKAENAVVPVVEAALVPVAELAHTLPEGILTQKVLPATEASPALRRRDLSDIKFQLADEDTLSEAAPVRVAVNGRDERDWLRDGGSDVVCGVYEGGFKTWECAFDLIALLDATYAPGMLDGKRVLELGCGSALPGIRQLQRHPQVQVDFQDYNREVLRLVTLPNVLANTTVPAEKEAGGEEAAAAQAKDRAALSDNADGADDDSDIEVDENEENEPEMDYATEDWHRLTQDTTAQETLTKTVAARSRFLAGDWATLSTALGASGQYDLILTAETIYHEASHAKLHDAICHALRKPDGVAYVAAKTVYFGCTGSTLTFEQHVQAAGQLRLERCHQVESSVRREILKLSWRV